MFCQNCGNQVPEGDAFCRNCGSQLNNTNVGNNAFSSVEEEELLRAYIGNNYDKFNSDGFNIWALLFPSIYTLYRKCYLYFLFLLLIPLVPMIGIIGVLVYIIVLACKFNEWYLKKAKEDVRNIKIGNPNASTEELKLIASKKGGTSLVGPIVYLVVLFIIIALIFYFFYYIISSFVDIGDSTFYDEVWDVIGGDISEENGYNNNQEDKYNSGIKEGKIKDLYYVVPTNYSLESYKEDDYGRYTYQVDSNFYCKVEITHKGTSLENFIVSIEADRSQWKEETINGDSYKVLYKDGTSIENVPYYNLYYVINKYNETYIFYYTETNSKAEECSYVRSSLLANARYNHNISSNDLDIA